MGTFIETSLRCVKWIGNCINKVVLWWFPFMENVNFITFSFLRAKRNKIESAENPKTVGEIVAIGKEKQQLEEKANQLYKDLTNRDRDIITDLLQRKNY